MNPRSFRSLKPSSRLLVAALCCLPLGNACSSDAAAPETPTTFGVEVLKLDGQAPDSSIALRCDSGGPSDAEASAGGAAAAPGVFSTLTVTLSLTTSDDATHFVLRPANACGSSTRCGFVRIEGLDDAGQVLTSVDTATTEGVLQLDLERLPVQLRVSLIRGLDRKPLQNPDETDVVTTVTTDLVAPSDCTAEVAGNGGAGGDSALPPGGAPGTGGDGSLPLGGAGGDGSLPGLGGAGAGGAADPASGAGGA